MGKIEVDHAFFRHHVKEWSDFEDDLKKYYDQCLDVQLPELSPRLPAGLRELTKSLNSAHTKLRGNLLDGANEAKVIADALYNTAQAYIRTDASNETEAKNLKSKIDKVV